ALQPFDPGVPEGKLGISRYHAYHPVPFRALAGICFGGALEVLDPSKAHELLAVDQLDHARRVVRAAQRDSEVQVVAQWWLGCRREQPAFKRCNPSGSGLVDRSPPRR